MRYSADQIGSLLARLDTHPASALETETLEFKEWSREWEHGESGRRKFYRMLAEYAVCFANHRGGALVLGVKERVKGRAQAITGCGVYNLHELRARVYDLTDPHILVEAEEVFLAYVRQYGAITNRITRELLGVSSFQASRILKRLTTEGKLCKEGTYKNAAYRLP